MINLKPVTLTIVDIYYQDGTVVSLQLYSILGSVGGLMGLYVGISVITVCEFVILIFDIFYHCLKVIFCRPKVQPVVT